MAEEIGSLAVKIGLDNTGFQSGITSINSQLKVLDSSFKANTAALGENAQGIDGLRLKMESLARQEELQRQKVAALQEAYNKSVVSKGADARATQDLEIKLNIANATLSNVQRNLATTNAELAVAERNTRLQSSAWTTLGTTVTNAGNKMKSAGDSIGKIGASITKVFTTSLPLIGMGFLKLGENFEKSFNTIRIGTGATGEALIGLEDDFKATLSQTGSSMEDTSQVIADLNTRTGLSGKSLQDLSLQMLKLAKISKEDLNTLIPATTRMFQDAGISTDKYAEALDYTFKVSQSTGIGVGRLQELMTQFGGPLRQMGFDWQTSAAMLGKFEKEGVNTELVVGSLRIALGRMAKDGISEPAKELQGMIEKIKAAGTAGEANALSLSMFGAKAGPDMAAAIREGRMDLDGLITSLKNSPETINKAAADTATFSGKLAKLKNQMSVAFEPIGTKFVDSFDKFTPVIMQVSNAIADIAKKIADLSPAQQGMILKFAFAAVAIGPVLSAISKLLLIGSGLATAFGTISGAIAVVTTGATAATPAIGALAAVFEFMTGPIGIAIAVISASGLILYKNWGPISGFFSNLWVGIKTTFTNFWEWIKGFFAKWGIEILAALVPFIGIPLLIIKHWDQIKLALAAIWDWIKTTANSVFTGIANFFINVWGGTKATAETVWNGIKTFFSNVWHGIVVEVMAIITPFANGMTGTWNSMKGGISTIFEGIKNVFSGDWEAIKNIFLGAILLLIDLVTGNFTRLKSDAEGIWNNLKTAFSQIWEGIKQIVTGTLQAISGYLSAAWEGIKTTATNIWNDIKTFFENLWVDIKIKAVTAWEDFKAYLGKLWTDVKDTATAAWTNFKIWIINVWNEIIQGAKDIWNGLITWFAELPDKLYTLAVNMFTSMKTGVGTTVSGVKNAVVEGIQEALNWIEALPAKMFNWGSDMITGLINGIKSMIDYVGKAVEGVAENIRSFLHFSVPDQGPLIDYESWMPDFMGGLAKGIENSKHLVKNAISGLSSDMKFSVNAGLIPSMAGATASSGTAVSNSYSYGALLHADKIVIANDMDIRDLAYKLEFYRGQAAAAKGGA